MSEIQCWSQAITVYHTMMFVIASAAVAGILYVCWCVRKIKSDLRRLLAMDTEAAPRVQQLRRHAPDLRGD